MKWMKNRIAIAAAVVTLLVAVVALGTTIVLTLDGADSEPESVPADTFVAVSDPTEEVAPGQKPKNTDEPSDAEKEEDAAEAEPEEADTPEPDPPAESEAPARTEKKKRAKRARMKQGKRENWKSAVLQVVTNFDQADVKVNGLEYPEYFEPGQPEGMVLPAGGPYDVEVKFGENIKHYRLHLRPYETRLLFVELSGFNSSAPPPRRPAPKKKAKKKEDKKDDDKDKKNPGKITVYSKPPGVIIVDGQNKEEKTPGSVELDNGRHEVQVKYESGSVSEKKIVRVRTGSRIKLFFRERK
jgi:hypothetical protein